MMRRKPPYSYAGQQGSWKRLHLQTWFTGTDSPLCAIIPLKRKGFVSVRKPADRVNSRDNEQSREEHGQTADSGLRHHSQGPTDPARNRPYTHRAIVLRSQVSQTTTSHEKDPEAGLLQITAAEVIAAARHLLAQTSEAPR